MSKRKAFTRVSVDIGGTFTDVVLEGTAIGGQRRCSPHIRRQNKGFSRAS
jgi:hypothetical protein